MGGVIWLERKNFLLRIRIYFLIPGGNAEQQEKYNLYGGLAELAIHIEEIERKLTTLESSVAFVQNILQSR